MKTLFDNDSLYPVIDATCFVSSERIYSCGNNLTATSCESKGCCFNASADIQCYYPSGCLVCIICNQSKLHKFDLTIADVNECEEDLDDCDDDATCLDINNGYTCICKVGYTGNGTTCESKHFIVH